MQGIRAQFEKQLKDKLIQKSNAKMSEEACLMKMFKFFDVMNTGCVDFNQFQRVLEKGGMYFPAEQLRPLFNSYDADSSGSLDYKEFAVAVFGQEAASKGQMQKKPPVAAKTASDLIKAFRGKMLQRGARSIIGIGRVFKIMDDNRSGTLDLQEFAKGCAESRLDFTNVDVQVLFQAFDKNGDGTVDYDEFLRVVKGPMNPKRVALVKRAYKKLDKDGSGEVDYNDICDTYNAKKHPAVLEGRKTERQILEEFLATFEMALSGVADGIVTEAEFLEYYTSISASIDNEDYFLQMMNSAWNIDGDAAQYKTYAKGEMIDETRPATASRKGAAASGYTGFAKHPTGKATMQSGVQSADNPFETATQYYRGRDNPQRKSLAAKRVQRDGGMTEIPGQESGQSSIADQQNAKTYNKYKQSHQSNQEFPQPSNTESMSAQARLVINQFKERIASRGAKGLIGLKKQFAIMDADSSGQLSLGEFQTVLDNFRVPGMCASDAERLFGVFDSSGDGQISFDEFLTALCGELGPVRSRLVSEAFDKLDANGNGTLELEEVKNSFDPTRHPDVISGTKNVEQARFGFFEMFTSFHNANNQFSGDKSVSRAEFLQYHQFLNESFERDVEFRNFLIGVWNMDLVSVGANEFAGKHPNVRGKNSREQWKYENHKILYGKPGDQMLAHEVQDQRARPARERADVHNQMPTAGGKSTTNFSGNKGIAVQGEREQRRAAQQNPKTNAIGDEELIGRVRDRIKARGARGILGLGKSFRIMDDDNSGALDNAEFSKALKSYQIAKDPLEIQAIFDTFDPDRNGEVCYDEFLKEIMGPMNRRREGLCRQAFKKIDLDGSGELDINDIRKRYNAKKHPDVMSGKQTEEDILYEFLDTFEAAYSIKHGDSKSRDRTVTIDEWIEYYQNVSASMDNDDYFELMMTNTWNLNNKAPASKAWAGEM